MPMFTSKVQKTIYCADEMTDCSESQPKLGSGSSRFDTFITVIWQKRQIFSRDYTDQVQGSQSWEKFVAEVQSLNEKISMMWEGWIINIWDQTTTNEDWSEREESAYMCLLFCSNLKRYKLHGKLATSWMGTRGGVRCVHLTDIAVA